MAQLITNEVDYTQRACKSQTKQTSCLLRRWVYFHCEQYDCFSPQNIIYPPFILVAVKDILSHLLFWFVNFMAYNVCCHVCVADSTLFYNVCYTLSVGLYLHSYKIELL